MLNIGVSVSLNDERSLDFWPIHQLTEIDGFGENTVEPK